jgi:hypothetical protein
VPLDAKQTIFWENVAQSFRQPERKVELLSRTVARTTSNCLITSITPKKRPISDYRESSHDATRVVNKHTSHASLDISNDVQYFTRRIESLEKRLQSSWSFSNQYIYVIVEKDKRNNRYPSSPSQGLYTQDGEVRMIIGCIPQNSTNPRNPRTPVKGGSKKRGEKE